MDRRARVPGAGARDPVQVPVAPGLFFVTRGPGPGIIHGTAMLARIPGPGPAMTSGWVETPKSMGTEEDDDELRGRRVRMLTDCFKRLGIKG